jgi:flagellar motility protein MotE (MotC chaperone)
MIRHRVRNVRIATPLVTLAAVLAVSGLIRAGDAVSAALALDAGASAGLPAGDPHVDISAALTALRDRQAELDRREAALNERLRSLTLAEHNVAQQMDALRDAEDTLRDLMTKAEEAAEGDLAQLTAVYENMKPKEAALLFERMSPGFAAGFLGRMRPDSAASILSGLTPELAYAISVLLAGRNAEAAAFAAGR